MRRVGLRIALASGGWSLAGAGVVAVAVAVGVAAILTLLSVTPAVSHRDARGAWAHTLLWAGPGEVMGPGLAVTEHQAYLADQPVAVVSVGTVHPGDPLPAGAERLPGRGEALVSPALARLVAQTPGAAGRYGRVVGTIGRAGLVGPDDLVAVRGVTDHDALLDGLTLTRFPTDRDVPTTPEEELALVLGAVALAAVVATLVGTAARMTARRRRSRLAVLGLLGATPAQTARVAEGEALVPSVAGVAAGIGLFFAVRPWVATYRYDGASFFPEDLWPGRTTVVGLAVLVVLGCLVAARAGAGRSARDALATARQGEVPPARPARWLALVVTVAVAVGVLVVPSGPPGRTVEVGVFVLVMWAVLVAGPEVSRTVGLALARVPRGAAMLAGRRLVAHPRDGFRPTAVVALALLVTTTFVALVPVAARSVAQDGVVAQKAGTARAEIPYATPSVTRDLVRALADVRGIGPAAAVRTGMVSGTNGRTMWIGDCDAIRAGTGLGLDCGDGHSAWATARARAELGGTTTLEVYSIATRAVRPTWAAPDSDEVTSFTFRPGPLGVLAGSGSIDLPDFVVEPSAVPGVERFRPDTLVFTYSSAEALERARTIVESGQTSADVATRATTSEGFDSDVTRLFDTVVAGSWGLAIVAAAALVLSLASRVHERRDDDATLRVTGVPPSTIGWALWLETAAPLVAVSSLAGVLGIGFGAAVVSAGGDGPYPFGAAVLPVVGMLGASLAVVSVAAVVATRNGRDRVPRHE